MKKIITAMISGLALLPSLSATAAEFGYTNGEIGRTWIYRMGIQQQQGQVIRIPSEKLALLRGVTIEELSIVFASRQTTDKKAGIFITTDLEGTPLVEQEVSITRALDWLSFPLDTKYTITGDEGELYIGYTAELPISGQIYHGDMTQEMPGVCFALNNGKWVDTYGTMHGMASIRFKTSDVSVTDAIMKPLAVDSYFKAGNKYDFDGQIFNFGSEPIKSFDLKVTVDGKDLQVAHVRDVNIAQGQNHDFRIEGFEVGDPGLCDVSFEVANVNGDADTDADDNDNVIFRSIYFYPQDMKRSFLLEGFTGQDCGNCPRGHADMEAFLENNSDASFIEIFHHSGYQPDMFSMDADYDCTFFYGSSSTFAPAFTLNRTAIAGQMPVVATSAATLAAAYENVINTQPYVSLDLESEFDPDTRKLKVRLYSYTHNDLPSETNLMNIWITQDGIIANQSAGGSNYTHNAVSRGTVTGNSWGVELPENACKSGGSFTYEKEIEIPEAIYSDFWTGQYEPKTEADKERFTIPAVAENMHIVAYVGAYGSSSDATKHNVYNCLSVPLTGGHDSQIPAGISVNVSESSPINIFAVGSDIVVEGDYDSIDVFTMGGRRVSAKSLPAGIYAVRVVADNKIIVKKILVK